MKTSALRITHFFNFLLIVILLSSSFYLEYYKGFVPCSLCILQRICFGLLGIFFFFGMLTEPKKIRGIFLGLFSSLIALSGLLLSARQVWLQHLPNNIKADCGPSITYLLKALPFDEFMMNVLQGSAECSAKGWVFLTLSLAEWALIFFSFFLIMSLWQTYRSLTMR